MGSKNSIFLEVKSHPFDLSPITEYVPTSNRVKLYTKLSVCKPDKLCMLMLSIMLSLQKLIDDGPMDEWTTSGAEADKFDDTRDFFTVGTVAVGEKGDFLCRILFLFFVQ